MLLFLAFSHLILKDCSKYFTAILHLPDIHRPSPLYYHIRKARKSRRNEM